MDSMKKQTSAQELLENYFDANKLMDCLADIFVFKVLSGKCPESLTEAISSPIKLEDARLKQVILEAIDRLKANLPTAIATIGDVTELASNTGHLIDEMLFNIPIEDLVAFLEDKGCDCATHTSSDTVQLDVTKMARYIDFLS